MNSNIIIKCASFVSFAIISTVCVFLPVRNFLIEGTNAAKQVSISMKSFNEGMVSFNSALNKVEKISSEAEQVLREDINPKISEMARSLKDLSVYIIPETEEGKEQFRQNIAEIVQEFRRLVARINNQGMWSLLRGSPAS